MPTNSTSAEIVEPQLTSRIAGRPKLQIASKSSPKEGLHYLSPADLPVWDALVDASPQGSVFCYSWWLDASDPAIRVLGYFEKGRLVAGMPLLRKRSWGVTLCGMADFPPFWGVVMEPCSGKRVTAASREMELLRVFASHLRSETFFVHDFHPSVTNWLPFYWDGFSQTSRCCYVVENLSGITRFSDHLKRDCGAIIQRLNELPVADEQDSQVASTENRTGSFSSEGLHRRVARTDRISRIVRAARKHDAGECFIAEGSGGGILASAVVVWDKRRAYHLYCPNNPTSNQSDLYRVLAYHSLQFAAGRFPEISFCMPFPEGADQMLLDMGARQVLYNRIFKLPWWSEVVLARPFLTRS